MPPVLQQPCRLGGHPPVCGVGDAAPLVYFGTHAVDERGDVVLLFLSREPLPLVEHQRRLPAGPFLLAWPGNGADEFRLAAIVDDALSRLPLLIQLPMTLRIRIRGIENGFFKERVLHGYLWSAAAKLCPLYSL